jgi:hypothetical protein
MLCPRHSVIERINWSSIQRISQPPRRISQQASEKNLQALWMTLPANLPKNLLVIPHSIHQVSVKGHQPAKSNEMNYFLTKT